MLPLNDTYAYGDHVLYKCTIDAASNLLKADSEVLIATLLSAWLVWSHRIDDAEHWAI